jgi:hypothetical protein
MIVFDIQDVTTSPELWVGAAVVARGGSPEFTPESRTTSTGSTEQSRKCIWPKEESKTEEKKKKDLRRNNERPNGHYYL